MNKKTAHLTCLLAALILPLLATCNAPFLFDNPADLDNPDYIHLASITLDRETITLVAGGSTSLSPTLTPAKAHDKRIEWTTSNAAVATVDSAGLVTAVEPGLAVIEAHSTSKNEIRASCTVTVVDATSKEITGFGFEGLDSDIPASINHEDRTITMHVPYGTDRSNLVPVITHTGAEIQPASGIVGNFTGNLLYTVTAMDESSADYTVTVSVSDAIITFNAHNSTPASLTRSVPYPSNSLGAAAIPADPSRADYTFSGWWTEPNGSGTRFEGTTTISASMTVHAHWLSQAKSMESFGILSPAVTGLINEASETIQVWVPYGTSLENLVAIFTTTGIQVRIEGTVQTSGSTPNDFSDPLTYTVVAEDGSTRNYDLTVQVTTLNAKEITSFSFTIGGSLYSGTINNTAGTILVTVPFGTNRNGLAPAITHFGKSMEPASGIARDFNTSKSYRVRALDDTYRDYTVTVSIANAVITFDADGGTPSTQTYMVEHPATTIGSLPASPARTGYSFSGWRTGRNGTGTAFGVTTTITGNTTVFAHWIPDIYSIAYQLNSGTNHGANPTSYTIESATILLQAPSRAGYDFLGWHDNEAYSGDLIARLEMGSIGGRTYYAKWGAKSYKVTFDNQSGTGGSDEVTAIYDQLMPSATAPTRSNHTFGGYYTQAEGAGTQYYSETMASLQNWDLAADFTLYAKWTPVSYSISYTLNGGANHEDNPGSYTIETSTINLGVPSHEGYNFDGWYDNPGFTGSVITQILKGSTGNKELHAKWTGKPYTVTFDQQNGSGGSTSVTVYYGQPMPTAIAPTRIGYTFGGYYTQASGAGTQYYSPSMASLWNWDIATNTTLYSKWTMADITSPNIGLLKVVPAGCFQRDGTAANISVITQPYRMSRYEITRAQFAAIMGTDPSAPPYSSGTNDPVQLVNWYAAIAFCNKLSLAEGLTPVYTVSGVNFSTLSYSAIPITSDATWNAAKATWTSNGYRLPTEMEWMWAAMGAPADGQGGEPNTTGYLKGYAGSTEGAGQNNIGNYAWYGTNSAGKTHPAGTKIANELGLFDLSGNLLEWCWDWSNNFAYANSGTLTDYRGGNSGEFRVLRGGSFYQTAILCTVAVRLWEDPSYRKFYYGFRVVRL